MRRAVALRGKRVGAVPVRQQIALGIGAVLQLLELVLPVERNARRHHIALLGRIDRGLQQTVEAELAVVAQDRRQRLEQPHRVDGARELRAERGQRIGRHEQPFAVLDDSQMAHSDQRHAPLERLRALGIAPIVDLCHFGVPDWIGDFQNTDFPEQAWNRALQQPDKIGLPDYANGNAEGYLFPATYEIKPGMKPVSMKGVSP